MVEFHQSADSSEYTPAFPTPLPDLLEVAVRNPRGLPETFGATPLNRAATFHDQILLLQRLDHLIEQPPETIPRSVQRYVEETFHDRFYERCVANDENYHRALLDRFHYDTTPELSELFDRAELGYASPAELLLTQSLLGIPSIELACVTHPYGRRIEEVYAMRQAVHDAVLALGGELSSDEQVRLRIKETVLHDVPAEAMPRVYGVSDQDRLAMADEYGGVACFLVTRKREIGTMPDGTKIRERLSFCLRADDEGVLNAADIDALRSFQSANWHDEALDAAGLQASILTLLEENEFTQVIPVSSTIYATNPALRAEAIEPQQASRPVDYGTAALRTLR